MARPRQVSDAEILDAARTCFLEQGPGVSTTVIAKRLGLSQAALFKRFKTKKDLLIAALLPMEMPPFIARLEKGPTPDPIEDQLREIALEISEFFREIVPCVSTLHASGLDKDDLFGHYEIPPPIRTQMAMVSFFTEAVEQGRIRKVPPIETATSFLGTLHVRAFMRHVGSPFIADDPTEYVANVVDLFVHGIEEER